MPNHHEQTIENHTSERQHGRGGHPSGVAGSDETQASPVRPAPTADEPDSARPPAAAGAATRSPAPARNGTAPTIGSIIKSVCLAIPLTGEQKRELRQHLSVLLSPGSSPLEKGIAMLAIIEKQLMPACGDVVEDNYKLFKITQTDARAWVKLAREHRAQNGQGASVAASSGRPAAPSANPERAASLAPAVNLAVGGLDVAQGAAPEEKQAPLLAVVVPPVIGQAHADTPPLVQRAQHAPTPAEPLEPPALAATAPTVTEPESKLAACLSQAPVHAIVADIEPPAVGSPGRFEYLKSVIHRGLTSFYAVGVALEEIRDCKLYRPQFKTFAAYIRHEWGWTRTRGYQLIGAAQVRGNLLTEVDTAQLSEPLCRVLAKLPADDQVAAWKDALSTAPDGRLMLGDLKMAVARLCPLPQAQPLDSPESEAASGFKANTGIVMPDNPQPTPPSSEPVTPSQPASAPETTPAPDVSPQISRKIKWQALSVALNGFFRDCPQDELPNYRHDLHELITAYPGLVRPTRLGGRPAAS